MISTSTSDGTGHRTQQSDSQRSGMIYSTSMGGRISFFVRSLTTTDRDSPHSELPSHRGRQSRSVTVGGSTPRAPGVTTTSGAPTSTPVPGAAESTLCSVSALQPRCPVQPAPQATNHHHTASREDTSAQPSQPQPSHKLKSQIITPVRPLRLLHHLQTIGYDPSKTQYLVDGFSHGFSLGHQGSLSVTDPPNDASITANHQAAVELLQTEVDASRLVGPFPHPPFPSFHVSPIKLAPKPGSTKFRLIHNLSYPYSDQSINSSIPESLKSVQYATVRDAIQKIIRLPKPVFTAKTDIHHAYKIIPISPADFYKLGMKFDDQYYFDRTLPFGCASACRIFETFSTALQAIYEFYADDDDMVHMLDDFFLAAQGNVLCSAHLAIFMDICDDLGVPVAAHKTTRPAQDTVFLGLQLDTIRGMALLPLDKLSKYASNVSQVLQQAKVKKSELESLVGQLSFATAVVPARAFLRRLYNLLAKVKRPDQNL